MGFCEIGSVTPLPQQGNPKPRLFRLPKDGAVINRFGFNNLGIDYVYEQLKKPRRGIVGINLGKNKTTTDPIIDFVKGCKKLSPLADYLVINVSSPNTPVKNITRTKLTDILSNVQKTRDKECGKNPPPLLVKIAPDLNEQDLNDIAQVAKKLKIDGIIISNTTLDDQIIYIIKILLMKPVVYQENLYLKNLLKCLQKCINSLTVKFL